MPILLIAAVATAVPVSAGWWWGPEAFVTEAFVAAGMGQSQPPPPDDDDDLLGGDDELLGGDEDLIGASKGDEPSIEDMTDEEVADLAADAHAGLIAEDRFPSAFTCRNCHPDHFREWAVSAHAYAQLSPVFNAMHGTILQRTNGTNGDFCIRCHTPVGMNLGESVFMSNMDRHPTSREGVTCIVCHRLDRAYGKLSGRLAIQEGDIFEPVFGPTGNKELSRVLEDPSYRVITSSDQSGGVEIHADAKDLAQIDTSAFCGACHDVTLLNGFRLEEAFSEFKASPAAARGESCHDCHMGKVPGVVSGYNEAPAAVVSGVPTRPRKRTNHMFAGPDYSIVHPGIFPHNDKAAALATMREWLEFEWEEGWGTDEFEDNIPRDREFPPAWQSVDDRYEARAIIEDNLDSLEVIAKERKEILQVGYKIDEVVVDQSDERGIRFRVKVINGTDGHNVPTGFDGERLVYLRVTVTDATGAVVMESGDLDPNGDVRDLHSIYVHNGELPLDDQLFSLQSRFLTRNNRGGEREQVLPINYSLDPLPFLRPATFSSVLTGNPLAARKHKKGIAPGDARWAPYRVAQDAFTGKGPYKADIALLAAMVPVHLIDEIKGVGFDYFMSPREVADAVRNGHILLWQRELTFNIHAASAGASVGRSDVGHITGAGESDLSGRSSDSGQQVEGVRVGDRDTVRTP